VRHIGLVTPAYVGHVNSMTPLGRELSYRGHRVTVISTLDAEKKARDAGLDFEAIGEPEFPAGSLERFTADQGTKSGFPAMRRIIGDLTDLATMMIRDLPPLLERHDVDALVVDQIVPMANVVAQHYGLPCVNVCSMLPVNTELGVPPFLTTWPYGRSALALARNAIGNRVGNNILAPLQKVVNSQRVKWGMRPIPVNDVFSDLAQIAQQPEFFDFPRKRLPNCFHYTGPFQDELTRPEVYFPWDKLDGRPLIYASMGTLQNRILPVFGTIAQACVGLDAQLVITLGRSDADIPAGLPGEPVVVSYAPQLELLKQAAVMINHGGVNSVMESLTRGVPMVTIPVALDQPGVAARVKHIGVGEFIPLEKVQPHKLRGAIQKVLSDPTYRANARRFQREIAELDGVGRACDLIEDAVRTNRPVLANRPPRS
jgi:zeaxanthin glucosyltransferase